MKAPLLSRVGALWMMGLLLMPVASLHAQPTDATLFHAFRWRNIGPANMGGRVVDIEAAFSARTGTGVVD